MRPSPIRRTPACLNVRVVGAILGVLLGASAPAAAQNAADELPVTLKADSYQFDRRARILTARGHVVLSAADVVIRSDMLVADLQSGLVTAEGNVELEVGGQAVTASMLTYNLSTRLGTLFDARAEYRSPLVLGTVRLEAKELAGDLARFVTIRNGFATTCAEPDPIVSATADELQIYPNDKIVGRRVSLWVAGRRLFTLPYFIIFLRERRETRITPVLGYSDAEGWSVRTSFSYFVNENHYGFVHADWFDRLGVGVGVEHLYRTRAAEGSALVYHLANRQTGGSDLRGVVNHVQRLGEVTARVFADHGGLSSATAPPSSSFFGALDLSTQTQQSSTYVFSALSQSSVGSASILTSRLVHAQNFAPGLTVEAFVNYSQSAGTTGVDDELSPRMTLRYFGQGIAATLVAETRVDLDGDQFTGDDRYVLERLPELTVSLSPFRIGETPLLGQAQVGLAQFRETTPGPTGGILDAGRADAQVTVSGSIPLAGGTVGMRMFSRQTWYTTGDARVFYGGRMEHVRPVTSALEARAGYTGQTTSGASPFVFDQIAGTLSVADAQMTYRTQNLLLRATGYYDFQAKQYGNVVGQAIYAPRPGWDIGLAGSYNVNAGRLERVEASVDLRLSEEWRVEYSGGWDSLTQNILHNRVSLTRTFCDCAAVSLTYLGARNEIWLEAWLTAIPWGRGKVGIGSQGTLLFEQPWWLFQQR